ncbi:hypothetical protein HDV01_001034 [Terramyces sp. JEL0728]|nr:hypothetical protein HDV01_001034 [Terramyces sp. JEL0728]
MNVNFAPDELRASVISQQMSYLTLPPDIVENTIFYFLNELDIWKLSHLNKEYYLRFSNIRILIKHNLQWPNTKLIQKKDRIIDASITTDLAGFTWKFHSLTIDTSILKLFYTKEAGIPPSYFLNLNISGDIETGLVDFINGLNPHTLNCSKVSNATLMGMEINKMSKLCNISLARVAGDVTDFICRISNTPVTHLALRNVVYQQNMKYTTIKSLDLSNSKLLPSDIFVLSLSLANLHSLDLTNCKLNKEGLRHIVQKLPDSNLEQLLITKNDLYPNDFTDFFNIIHLTKIKEFEFHGKLGTKALAMLIKNISLSQLQRIYLEVPLECLKEFLIECGKSKIHDLTLIKSFQGNEVCKVLAQYINIIPLERLGFSLYNMTVGGLEALFKSLTATRIKQFSIDQGDFCNKALETISTFLPSTKIQVLALQSNNFDDNGVSKLADGTSKVRQLRLAGRVSKKGIDDIVCKSTNIHELEVFTTLLDNNQRNEIKALYRHLLIKL